jgi:hypothetical protein
MPAIWAAGIGAVGSIATANVNKNKSPAQMGYGGSAVDGWADGRTTATQVSSMFDNSGWNVSFGNDSPITAPTTNNKTMNPSLTASPSPSLAPTEYGLGGGLSQMPASLANGNWMTYAIVFIVILVIVKKTKKKG